MPFKIRWAYLFQAIDRAATLKNKLLLTTLLLGLVLCFWGVHQFWEPLVMLDFYSNYSTKEVFDIIKNYSQNFRIYHVLMNWTVDLFLLLGYGLGGCWLFIYILKQSFPWLLNDLYKVVFLPFLLSIVDLLENVSITSLILFHPMEIIILTKIANFFTESKWIIVILLLMFIIIGTIAMVMNRKEVLHFYQEHYPPSKK